MGARVAIWIVSDPRPEHIAAITWLNESSAANFYLLKIEAIQIGDSLPAPLLTVIVGPSEEGKEVGRINRPGEYFGEMSSLLNLKRTATVSSTGRSVVQIFPGEDLEATLTVYPRLAKKIIDTIASRLVDANKRITELSNGKGADFLSS